MKRAFGDKLRRAFPGEQSQPGAEALRETLRRQEDRSRSKVAPVDLPEGVIRSNDRGECFVRTLRYPLSTCHGDLALGAAFEADGPRLAGLAKLPAESAIDLNRCLFLDTETTGLGGGAGTVVFMVGMGFFEGSEGRPDAFVVEQTFLRCFAEEPAALEHTAHRLRQRPQLVTFVGKSFDRHRIAARMAVHRVRSHLFTPEHLDLYYMARRAWASKDLARPLPDVRLQTVERLKLGVHRADDLPGSAAPLAFLDWIRDRSGPVDRVFEHNRLDVLTLVTLLARLGRNP